MSETDMAGRCISCGFLAYVGEFRNQHLTEVEPEHRRSPIDLYGASMFAQFTHQTGLAAYLVCFLRKADLLAEVEGALGEAIKRRKGRPPEAASAAIRGVLEKDRRCPFYIQYEVGLSPKEHLMERRLLGLEEDRRAFQKALDRSGKRLAWAALILGSLFAAGQIIAALIAMTPDSYGAKLFRSSQPSKEQSFE